ncbi:MAG: hypothetical protein GXY36_11805 [Chloroflexi bacterium]|nr:hypothetical protein [Chloroflexota bacterium]
MAGRVIATMVVWVMMGSAMIALFASSGPGAQLADGYFLGALIVLGLTAVLGTAAVWNNGPFESTQAEESKQAKGKRTQPDRVRRLVNSLDDDEVYELEALLLGREEQARHSRHDR